MSTTMTPVEPQEATMDGLRTLLADTYALMAQTHFAHWNVQGADFFQLHEAFQHQYEELFSAVDELAERLRALKGIAPGGLKHLAQLSTIAELPDTLIPAKDLVRHLIEGHESLIADAFALKEHAAASADLETQDLVTRRGQAHQKTLWMLNSYLK